MTQSKSVKAEKKNEKEVEAEANKERMRWVKNSGYVYRFRFIVKQHAKTPRTFKIGSTKLFYAKSLEHLADRIAKIPYIQAIVGDIEHFNTKTQKWEAIDEYN